MARAAGSTSSTEPAEVVLGRVIGAHGLRGELRVRLEGDGEDLAHVPSVWLVREGNERQERSEEFEIAGVRPGRSGECRVRLEGLADRDTAESWRGAAVRARAADLPSLLDGEFYAFELVGCDVQQRDGERIGTVREIWETGASDLLVVRDADGRDQLLPAVEPLLVEVDRQAKRIVVDLPPGLLQREPSQSNERE
ncbi:MAG: ribosome maturation factor RimM [Myxococcota bacterium]